MYSLKQLHLPAFVSHSLQTRVVKMLQELAESEPTAYPNHQRES